MLMVHVNMTAPKENWVKKSGIHENLMWFVKKIKN
jgi:hypothetical protein